MANDLPKSLPKVFGFYLPASRETDFTGELTDRFTGEVYTPASMTKQEFVEECDINNIVKEYLLTGQIAHISAKAALGTFEDLPDPVDFQEAMNLTLRAQFAFSELPSAIRNRFDNDPERFLAFCSDPANAEELRTLGLAKPLPPAEPLSGPEAAPQPLQQPGK